MDSRLTRRSLITGAGAGAGALLLGRGVGGAAPLGRSAQSALPLIRGGRFTQSVASGQQSLNGITLWTKLEGVERTSRLQVEISRDEDFRSVLYRQDVVADAEKSFAVHHRAENRVLAPGERYFYRFFTCDENSPVGQFRTARPADSAEPIRIGFFSCQDFVAGYYVGHRGLAQEPDLDVVVCLGDYIYEHLYYEGPRQDTTGANKDGEVQTLEEYRAKYALYHSDKDLLAMRAKVPLINIWDDHEVEDNYAKDKPGAGTKQVRIPFAQRKVNGYRAFFEHMPRIRVPEEPDRTYGTIPLGANAELFLLDQRQYRDDQPCGDQFFVPCTESEAAGRTLLGATQKAWLKEGLERSRARWKVVANQAMIMSLDGPRGQEINKDQWDGYAAERQEILEHVRDKQIKDLTFITGDIHSFYVGNVTPTGRGGAPGDPPPVATEFVGGSLTSQFIFPPPADTAGGVVSEVGILSNNPHIKFANTRDRGYAVMECRPDRLNVTFRAARSVTDEKADVYDLAKYELAPGEFLV